MHLDVPLQLILPPFLTWKLRLGCPKPRFDRKYIEENSTIRRTITLYIFPSNRSNAHQNHCFISISFLIRDHFDKVVTAHCKVISTFAYNKFKRARRKKTLCSSFQFCFDLKMIYGLVSSKLFQRFIYLQMRMVQMRKEIKRAEKRMGDPWPEVSGRASEQERERERRRWAEGTKESREREKKKGKTEKLIYCKRGPTRVRQMKWIDHHHSFRFVFIHTMRQVANGSFFCVFSFFFFFCCLALFRAHRNGYRYRPWLGVWTCYNRC